MTVIQVLNERRSLWLYATRAIRSDSEIFSALAGSVVIRGIPGATVTLVAWTVAIRLVKITASFYLLFTYYREMFCRSVILLILSLRAATDRISVNDEKHESDQQEHK